MSKNLNDLTIRKINVMKKDLWLCELWDCLLCGHRRTVFKRISIKLMSNVFINELVDLIVIYLIEWIINWHYLNALIDIFFLFLHQFTNKINIVVRNLSSYVVCFHTDCGKLHLIRMRWSYVWKWAELIAKKPNKTS